MTHNMVIELGTRGGEGLVPRLVCSEPEGFEVGCRNADQHPDACSIVQAFDEDRTAAMEDYFGPSKALYSAPIVVYGIDEYTFSWGFREDKHD